jgi:hypothetical protein
MACLGILNGHGQDTRRKLNSSQSTNGDGIAVQPATDGIFWPALLLPSVVPNTRIWTLGYDADIDGFWSSASQNTVSQHAANLLRKKDDEDSEMRA